METAINLRRDIEVALRRHHLNEWRRKFLTDILTRIDRSGDGFTLTDKQWRKVFEILGDRSNVVQFQARETSPARPRSPRYSGSKFTKRRSHRLTWGERRFLTAIVVLAVIACLQFVTGSSKFGAVNLPSSSTKSEFASGFRSPMAIPFMWKARSTAPGSLDTTRPKSLAHVVRLRRNSATVQRTA
jgi:hypothetical protein